MRSEHLSTQAALELFLKGFEEGTLDKREWTHGAHVAAAAYYLFGSNAVEVLPRMRVRIRSFNEAVGGQNTATSGYHETLTHFWLLMVEAHLREAKPESHLEAARTAVGRFGEERALHALYYSGDVVKDSEARLAWRAPDLRPLPEG
jgi:hypothetical protein